MSDRPQITPVDDEVRRHQELVLYLPPGWRVANEPWPARLLTSLAWLPHTQRTFLAPGHTIALANPPRPFAPDSLLVAALLTSPLFERPDFDRLAVDGIAVRFLNVVPITAAELELKLEDGLGALYDRLADGGLSQIVDARRACLVTGARPATGAGQS
jgi:hypothetical protein